jgi:hypothetical protein
MPHNLIREHSSDNRPHIKISNEEKLKIAQHYLLSSPPGQFYEILGGRTPKYLFSSFHLTTGNWALAR